jgi:hypothetical protein
MILERYRGGGQRGEEDISSKDRRGATKKIEERRERERKRERKEKEKENKRRRWGGEKSQAE